VIQVYIIIFMVIIMCLTVGKRLCLVICMISVDPHNGSEEDTVPSPSHRPDGSLEGEAA
jgi:hypothetical protein